MIVVRLMGGLGNQLWQMAFAESLTSRGYEVQLSTAALGRKYELEGYHGLQVVDRGPDFPIIREDGFRFDESKLNPPDNCIMAGYWQSEKYFDSKQNIRHQIRTNWQNEGLRELAADYYEYLYRSQETSLAIHVRRGDYLRLQNYHGVLPIEYYKEAVRFVRSRYIIDKILVFSDDPQWCYENFPTNFKIVRGTTSHEDLQLMSFCKHIVIANSSFSWWGAFLGDDWSNRTVVAPAQWFTDPTAQSQTQDLIPERWTRI